MTLSITSLERFPHDRAYLVRHSAQAVMSKLSTSDTTESMEPYKGDSPPVDQTDVTTKRYFLGIDGGGTKTQAAIIDYEGRTIGEGLSGAANPLRFGLDEAISHVGQAASNACASAGIDLVDIQFACAAIAGIKHRIHYHAMKEALDKALHIAGLELVTDAQAALEGALDGKPGVVVIAGTGSIAIGINEAGQQARAGGLGPTLSDEGSGYDIARRALRAVAASFDGRAPQTSLTERICEALGIADASDLPSVIYNSDSDPVDIAPLAELVDGAARAGDEVARQIMAAAGSELGCLAASVIEKLGLSSSTFRVACVGGVFKSGDFVIGPLREAVLRIAARAEIGPPVYPPVIGAARLAKTRSNTSTT